MKRVLPIAGLVSLLIALAACGGGGSRSASTQAPAVVTTPAATLVLTVSDLPTGWTVDTSKSSGSSSDDCSIKGAIKIKSSTHADAGFKYGGTIPDLFQSLAVYDSTQVAANTFRQAKSALDNCKGANITDNGKSYRLVIGATSFPAIGSESAAYTASMSVQGIMVTLGFVIVRQGNVNFALGIGDLGSSDIAKLEQFARIADNKVVTLNKAPTASTASTPAS